MSYKGAEGRVRGLGVPIHVTLSPPEKEAMILWDKEVVSKKGVFKVVYAYEKLRKKAVKVAKAVGIKGGCMIIHPWRNDLIHEDDYPYIKRDNDDGVDIKSLAEYYKRLGKSVSFWYRAPHFHLLCYGWLDEDKLKAVFDSTGWVVKNHGIRNSVFSTAHYQLSHAGVHSEFHTVTWFGCMSNRLYRELNPDPRDLRKGNPICPECGEYLVDLRYDSELRNELEGAAEGGYWLDPGGWRLLAEGEKNHCLYVSKPTVEVSV